MCVVALRYAAISIRTGRVSLDLIQVLCVVALRYAAISIRTGRVSLD